MSYIPGWNILYGQMACCRVCSIISNLVTAFMPGYKIYPSDTVFFLDHIFCINSFHGATMRATAAAMSRGRWKEMGGGERAEVMSDAELMDSIDYTLFPNFHPWGAFNRIVYRFRPDGDNHRSCIMECIFLAPWEGDEKPPPAPIHWLEDHEIFSDAPELGMLGKVFDQDLYNMPKVQKGLETTRKPGVTLANYQEAKVRWLHDKLTEWVEGD